MLGIQLSQAGLHIFAFMRNVVEQAQPLNPSTLKPYPKQQVRLLGPNTAAETLHGAQLSGKGSGDRQFEGLLASSYRE